jgi:hypothetical protein
MLQIVLSNITSGEYRPRLEYLANPGRLAI